MCLAIQETGKASSHIFFFFKSTRNRIENRGKKREDEKRDANLKGKYAIPGLGGRIAHPG